MRNAKTERTYEYYSLKLDFPERLLTADYLKAGCLAIAIEIDKNVNIDSKGGTINFLFQEKLVRFKAIAIRGHGRGTVYGRATDNFAGFLIRKFNRHKTDYMILFHNFTFLECILEIE